MQLRERFLHLRDTDAQLGAISLDNAKLPARAYSIEDARKELLALEVLERTDPRVLSARAALSASDGELALSGPLERGKMGVIQSFADTLNDLASSRIVNSQEIVLRADGFKLKEDVLYVNLETGSFKSIDYRPLRPKNLVAAGLTCLDLVERVANA